MVDNGAGTVEAEPRLNSDLACERLFRDPYLMHIYKPRF